MSGAVKKKKRRRRLPPRWRKAGFLTEYAALKTAAFLLRLLPVDAASALMGWCWRHVAPHTERHPRALKNLAAAFPERSEAERERIARAMWENLGRVFAESLMIDRILAQPERIVDNAAPLIARVRQRPGGIVCLSLHTGNWEIAVTPSVRAGIPAAGIYQRLKNPYVDTFVQQTRQSMYERGLFAKGADIGRTLFRIVRQGGTIGMLADLRDRRGVEVPFFGRPAPSTTFPALMTRGNAATLMAMRVIRKRGAWFVIEGEEIEVPRTEDREADILQATQATQALFERWIREYPEQWMWAHRRWK